jgi:hypothetical protein
VRTDTQHVTGALIGGTFGAVFVLADANTPLGDVAAAVFRIGAVGGLLGLYLGAARTRRHHARRPAGSWADTEGLNLFARRYWLIVAGELALIGIGLGALGALGAPQQANVAWIALIVGLHFIAFRVADVWGNNVLRPAAALVAFGLAGLGLAAASYAGWTSFVSGVLSGFVLLSGSSYALGTRLPDNRARAKSNFANTCPPDRERRRTGPRAQLSVLPRTSVRDPRTIDKVEDHA